MKMKEKKGFFKKKKLLLGLTLGSIMSTAPFLTACSSDITFNQTDLDKAIKNVNEYLEIQNNYSSEFAKNVLNDYLLKGVVRNQDNSKFGYKVTNNVQNSFNDSYASCEINYKFYRQGDAIKELCNIDGDSNGGFSGLSANTNNYREITSEYKQTIAEPGSLAMGKTYYYTGTEYCEKLTETNDKYSKTTFENKTKSNVDDWMFMGDLSNIYSNLMLAIVAPESSYFGMGNYFTNQTGVVMGQEGEYEVFTFTNVFAETPDGETIVLSFNIKFKDGVLNTVTFTNSLKDDYAEALEQSQTLTIEINENISDFGFDKTPYNV